MGRELVQAHKFRRFRSLVRPRFQMQISIFGTSEPTRGGPIGHSIRADVDPISCGEKRDSKFRLPNPECCFLPFPAIPDGTNVPRGWQTLAWFDCGFLRGAVAPSPS